MKLADCNTRQKKAFINIYHAANWLIGGLENILSDYDETSVEYKEAKNTLADHDGLILSLYDEAISTVYTGDSCISNKSTEAYLKDIRFCGKEWLMERCEARIRKLGY